jgi:hypothetical protein
VEARHPCAAAGYQCQSTTRSAEALFKRSASCIAKGINEYFFSKIMIADYRKQKVNEMKKGRIQT